MANGLAGVDDDAPAEFAQNSQKRLLHKNGKNKFANPHSGVIYQIIFCTASGCCCCLVVVVQSSMELFSIDR